MGSLVIELDGKMLTGLESRTVAAILIYLLGHRQPVPRDTLANFFWDDRTQAQASANLRAALSRLRKHVGDHLIITRQTVGFDHARRDYWVDAFRIEAILGEQLAREAPDLAQIEQALEWYRGDFLTGFYLNESRGFEAWMVVQRERLRNLAAQALALMAKHDLQRGAYARALVYTQRWIALDPLDERAHRQLMRLYVREGKRHSALQQYETMRRLLDEELGVEPEPASQALFERFSVFTEPPIHVPHLTTPFVGRQRELKQILSAIRDQSRSLITVVGAGGVGKTTLAIEAAHSLIREGRHTFLDGVFYISLAGTPSSDLLADAIIAGLGLTPGSARNPEAFLRDYLAPRELLVVLDNFEHLLDARSRRILQTLLRHAPDLTLIVTSRGRLGLDAEWSIQPPGLAYPDAADAPDVAAYPAVQLFLHHAHRLAPDFAPGPDDLAAIVEICHLVQGMPLGLELAASWIRLYEPAVISARIHQNIDLLDAGQTDALGRPRSMRATFDAAWATLPTDEQNALRRMALFRGPFTLAAAERVAAAGPRLLQRLADKALLRHEEGDLWSLHPLFRGYCSEKLAQDEGDHESARQRHTEHYVMRLAAASAALAQAQQRGQRAEDARRRLRQEIDNVRSVWDRLAARTDPIPGEQLINFIDDFGRYLFAESWYREATLLYERALARSATPALVRGRWQRKLGRAYLGLGQPGKAIELFLQALSTLGQPQPPSSSLPMKLALVGQLMQQARFRLPKQSSHPSPEQHQQAQEAIRTYDRLSRAYYYDGQPEAFGFCALRSLNLGEAAGIPAAQARGYANLCMMLGLLGKHRWAQSYLQRARGLAIRLHDAPSQAYVYLVTGVYDGLMGVWQRSNQALHQAMEVYLHLGDVQQWGEGFSVWCTNLYAQGRFQEAATERQKLIEAAQAVGNDLHEAWGLSGRAAALLVMERPEEARALLQQSLHKLSQVQSPQNALSAQALLGLALLRLGEPQEAFDLANAVMIEKDATSPTFATNVAVYESVCVIYLDLLELPPAQQSALGFQPERLLAQIDRISAALMGFARIARMGQPRAWLYRGLYHWQRGQRRRAFRHWRRSLVSARDLAMPYDEARAQYALGRHLPEGAEERAQRLAAAIRGFEATGARRDLRLMRQS